MKHPVFPFLPLDRLRRRRRSLARKPGAACAHSALQPKQVRRAGHATQARLLLVLTLLLPGIRAAGLP